MSETLYSIADKWMKDVDHVLAFFSLRLEGVVPVAFPSSAALRALR
jgi:hypothetical protein